MSPSRLFYLAHPNDKDRAQALLVVSTWCIAHINPGTGERVLIISMGSFFVKPFV